MTSMPTRHEDSWLCRDVLRATARCCLGAERVRGSGALAHNPVDAERAKTACKSNQNPEPSRVRSKWGARPFAQTPPRG